MNIINTLENSEKLLSEYQHKITAVPYEEKGVLFSEVLFILATITGLSPRQLLESGRARGQSTHLLGLCLPNVHIISLERDASSIDVPIAEKRLGPMQNVSSLYGDAQKLTPELVLDGDIVIIDGPKGFRAVRLALKLLATGKPACVFVHDLYQGLPERDFVEKHLHQSFFSDNSEFVSLYSGMDKVCWDTIKDDDLNGWQPYHFDGKKQKSYGPTMTCIPYDNQCSYRKLLLQAEYANFMARMKRSMKKRENNK